MPVYIIQLKKGEIWTPFYNGVHGKDKEFTDIDECLKYVEELTQRFKALKPEYRPMIKLGPKKYRPLDLEV